MTTTICTVLMLLGLSMAGVACWAQWGEMMKSVVSTYGNFIADVIREDREYNESTIEKLCAALEQCKLEVEQFKRLSHGKQEFQPTKGMEMAETVLKEVRGDA